MHFGKKSLNSLSFNPQSLKEWICQKEEKKVVYWCMLLFLPLMSLWFFHIFFSFFFYLFFLLFLVPPFYYSQLLLFILFAMVGFTIFISQLILAPYGCPSKIVHWLAGCLGTTITLNALVASLSIPKQNCLSCFLPLSVFHFLYPNKD